ncbi:MAG: dTDP-4-dehydrorhamnose 3,5-epimerase [Geminicoccaceae bacterium]
MERVPTNIPDVLLFRPKRHGDARGFFSEIFNADALKEFGIDFRVVQENHSRSAARLTLRGLHFQRAPYAQAKLVRVLRGALLDVAVDLRQGSSTYGHYVAAELSDENGLQMLVPKGFAHGLLTLTADTDVLYLVDHRYVPEAEDGVRWDDPTLEIDWKLGSEQPVINDRDLTWPLLT